MVSLVADMTMSVALAEAANWKLLDRFSDPYRPICMGIPSSSATGND